MDLLDDKSERGFYCSDAQLAEMAGVRLPKEGGAALTHRPPRLTPRGQREAEPRRAEPRRSEPHRAEPCRAVLRSRSGRLERGAGGDSGGDAVPVGGGRAVRFAGATRETSRGRLRGLFEDLGPLEEFAWHTGADGWADGTGVVRYASEQDAARAVWQLSGAHIGRAMLHVSFDQGEGGAGDGGGGRDWVSGDQYRALPDRVFFAGMPRDTPFLLAHECFEAHGPVKKFQLRGQPRDGTGSCIYETASDADRAMASGVTVEGVHLYLERERPGQPPPRWWTPLSAKAAKVQGKRGVVFFANAPTWVPERYVLRLFAGVGVLLRFKLKVDGDGFSTGNGSAVFTTAGIAQRAVERLQGTSIEGRRLFVWTPGGLPANPA